jgi:cobalt-zinc-cadmium efflux system outer membrane protein
MRPLCHALILVAVQASWAATLGAQDSSSNSPPGGSPTEQPPPGAHTPYENQPGGSIIGSRPGSMRPRVPINKRQQVPQATPSLPAPLRPQVPARPVYVPNAWSLLFELEDEGPAAGLTLEQGIDRLVRASISLRAKALDIPQARADVLTAGMHANPVVYFDSQLIPYRPYNSVTNPGGPTQYDLNVAYPVDLSGKRRARVEVACAAQRVTEALYQDAVRQEIDRLGSAYVDALAARLALRTTKSGLAKIDEIRKQSAGQKREARDAEALRRQIQIQRQTVALALIEAEAAWKSGQRSLSMMLNLPHDEFARLELRGTIGDHTEGSPPLAELVSSALANRPDLAAYRLGLQRAVADVGLSRANRLPDVYVLYQPFTFQDNTPFNQPSSRSWAVGATVTVPLFDRNQGNIQRATVNVEQSQLELRALEQRIVADVEGAYDEYVATQQGLEQIEKDLLPDAEKARGESLESFRQGTLDAGGYLSAQRDLEDLGRQYRDLLVRHRRSMLAINTAVGLRVFP